MEEKIFVTKSIMPPYEEFIEAIKPLWDTHMITNMGVYYRELGKRISEFSDGKMISLFSNGHMALEMCIQAMHLDGEVITTPFTFASTTHAIVRNGLKPVFCDINPVDATIDIDKIESLITEHTTAIVPVHVYGNVCNVEEIERIAKKHKLCVIYDAAHAFGERYMKQSVARFGDASMFSFHATKAFNTIEGGAVATSSKTLMERMFELKNFGFHSEVDIDEVGANAKMNEFQAIMGLCNLKHFYENVQERKIRYDAYTDYLKDVPGIRFLCLENNLLERNYSYFPIVVDFNMYGRNRDELITELKQNNVIPRRYFYPIITQFHCYKDLYGNAHTPVAMDVSKKVMTLPLYAELDIDKIKTICTIIKNFSKVQ